jgi:D-alanyl-D-alanine carboxypeptidase
VNADRPLLSRSSARRPGKRGLVTALGIGAIVLSLVACSSDAAAAKDPVAGASGATSASPKPKQKPKSTPTPTPTAAPFNKAANSVDDPSSIWVVVNKTRSLNPANYAPTDLVYPAVTYVNRQPMRAEVANALVAMFAAGASESQLQFSVQSAYRSFAAQTSVYDQIVDTKGQAQADTTSARPGHSEHQTGLAVDISALPASCSLQTCFANTPQGKWLAANAWKYGFVLRYPADKVAVTGYSFEPWHYRYVGIALSTELHNTGVETLEEFFALPGGTTYH